MLITYCIGTEKRAPYLIPRGAGMKARRFLEEAVNRYIMEVGLLSRQMKLKQKVREVRSSLAHAWGKL